MTTSPITDNGSISNLLLSNKTTLLDLLTNINNYGYEINGNIYKVSDVNTAFKANPTAAIETIYSNVESNDTSIDTTPTTTISAVNDPTAVNPTSDLETELDIL